MRNTTGFIIELSEERLQKLREQMTDRAEDILSLGPIEFFSEPVPEFQVRENKNFICFLTHKGELIMLAEGTRSYPGGTDLRQINLKCSTIYTLEKPIELEFLINQISSKVKRYAEKALNEHRIIPPATVSELISTLSKEDPKINKTIEGYQKKNVSDFLVDLSKNQRQDLAFQKAAVADALFFADIERIELEDWDVPQNIPGDKPLSYLSGLKSVRLRESEMINHDLNNLPGFNLINRTSFDSTVFDNGKVRLTVLVTDKKPLEEDMGVDLIYYNEFFKSFVMVQYKAMEPSDNGPIYRLPNKQLEKEIKAMDNILEKIKVNKPTNINDFRIFYNPFFLKLCSRVEFDPDSKDMMPGMYFPLDYWKILENDETIKGPRGGKGVTYENMHKKFTSTDFKGLLVSGWIGTDATNSAYLEKVIKEAVESGKRIIYAVEGRVNENF